MIATQERIDLNALKQSVDLLALVRSRGHEPTRHGNNRWKINCPFHDDKEASLIITPAKNLWHCMGCDRGGSAIDFIKESDQLTTGQAIRELAARSNGLIKPASELKPDPEPPERTPEQQKLLNKAAEFYHKALHRYAEGRSYLRDRGIADAALLETFKVGFANGTLHDALPSDGDLLQDLQAVGLIDHRGKEHFRDCVVFPIHDEHGNVLEMYGRKIHDNAHIKHLYLPGPHAGVFNYACARSFKDLLLTESVLDACALWQAGFKNTIALYGTNGLTNDHLTLFRIHGTEQITLVMDGDQAGRSAAERLTAKLQAQGLDVCAVDLSKGEDPNSYLQSHSVEDFGKLLQQAHTGKAASANPLLEEARIEKNGNGFRLSVQQRAYDVTIGERRSGKIRATIKALTTDRLRFHIDTVELYQARSRKSFTADAAKLYGQDPDSIALDLNRIIRECDATAEDPDAHDVPEVIRLTEKDRREAEAFGRRKDLLDTIAKDIRQCGYIGERANVLTAYLAMTSRKMLNPLALMVLSGSGAGKSAMQDTVLSLCPEEDLVKVTSLTERALFYKDETSLKHKVLALEELAGAEDASYAVRNLISSGVLVIETTVKDPTTGRMTTMQNTVYGPTAVFLTTTQPDLDPETCSRFMLASIDESPEQTKRILEAQRKARTVDGLRQRLRRDAVREKHHRFQRLLRPVDVRNPFGELLTYTDDRLLMRRDNPKYLALIDAVAFLHQMQKPVKRLTESGTTIEYIEVSLRDIALANELAAEILGHSLDELSGPSRKLLLLIEDMVTKWAAKQNTEPHLIEFSRKQLREHARWTDYQVRTHLAQLVELEYVAAVSGRFGQQYQYRLLWDGRGRDGQSFMLGLKPIEQLRREAEALGMDVNLEGQNSNLEG